VLIHEHASDGDVAGVVTELARGVDVDARDGTSKKTPLMQAVESPRAGPDVVRVLIERGADVNAVGGLYAPQPELSFAVSAGNVEQVTVLLDAGADIRYRKPERYDVLIDAMYGRPIATDPHLVPLVRLLIDHGARLDSVTTYEESALSVASNNGRFDAVRVLLEAGADPAPLEWTPLMRAIALGSVAEVEAQLAGGADLTVRDFWSRTPWLLGLQAGDVAKARRLLAAGADRADRGRCGKVPLTYPIGHRDVEMLRWLLSEGFDPDQADDFKTTPLMEAAEQRHPECAKLLIDAGANIHLTNHVGHQAITLAGDLAVVRLLVQRGADLNDISDEMRAALTRLPADGRLRVSREDYLAANHRRFGERNPDPMNLAFWKAMVASGANAWAAKQHFGDTKRLDEPVWCFQRFGKSINELPDGRIIEIGGEHEDHYDPDFCIYNDVVVHRGDGTFDIFGYPRDVFPPTDFHTATLVGGQIYIIGGLGYRGERRYGATPVYRLDVDSLAIEPVPTTGESPGWISRHRASYDGGSEIRVSGGKLCVERDGAEEYQDNTAEHVLNLSMFVWRRSRG